MAIVGTCENEPPNQLPAWTSNSFAVFLERDPAGLPPYLGQMEGGRPALRSEWLQGAITNLEARFFFDSGTTGSIALRKDASVRNWGDHIRGRPDVVGGDGVVSFPAETAVLFIHRAILCRSRSR